MKNSILQQLNLNQYKPILVFVLLLAHLMLFAQNDKFTPTFGNSKGDIVGIDSVQANHLVSIGDLLRGKSAGVTVIKSDGAPGSAFDILIRRGASLRGNEQPLYILDGIIINPSQLDVPNSWENVDKGFLHPC